MAYNPLAEIQAKRGPFQSVRYIASEKTDLETFFDYTQLSQGIFNASSRIANLTILTLEGKRTKPKNWELQFNYLRGFGGHQGKRDKNQMNFTVRTETEKCTLYTKQYGDSMQQVITEINPQTGVFALTGLLQEPVDKATFMLQASGTAQSAKFAYLMGDQSIVIFWKNNAIFQEHKEEMDDRSFFAADTIFTVRKLLEDELHFCQYINALEQ